ncbi:hypothetical protein H131_10543 [Lysinibacillus sphaericus OT4b.31]|uniref:Uncharacterized protein n=1 Tax=Lysinibacillus sphaericus OT4b.31 TaxID=1285586 RepID=R7ZEM8_LYSSH|nr:hypothetical protein H131_10543 [Lysinibacillus sphaericus OT4b.31]
MKGANNQFLDIEIFRFIPARNHSNMPCGIYDWSEMRAVHNGGLRYRALISLTQPAGFQTGFLGTSATYPVNRWANERDRFQHIGFPGDHTDEMWIDDWIWPPQ